MIEIEYIYNKNLIVIINICKKKRLQQVQECFKKQIKNMYLKKKIFISKGNMITLIIVEAKLTGNQVYETIFYSSVVFIATVVFIILAYFYKYVEDEPKLETVKENEISQI